MKVISLFDDSIVSRKIANSLSILNIEIVNLHDEVVFDSDDVLICVGVSSSKQIKTLAGLPGIDNVKKILVVKSETYEEIIAENSGQMFHQPSWKKMKLLIIKDLYGEEASLDKSDFVNINLARASFFSPLVNPIEQFDIFPVYLDDAVAAVIKQMFSYFYDYEEYLVGDKTSTVHFVELLREIRPKSEVVVTKFQNANTVDYSRKQLIFVPTTKSKIKEALVWIMNNIKSEKYESVKPIESFVPPRAIADTKQVIKLSYPDKQNDVGELIQQNIKEPDLRLPSNRSKRFRANKYLTLLLAAFFWIVVEPFLMVFVSTLLVKASVSLYVTNNLSVANGLSSINKSIAGITYDQMTFFVNHNIFPGVFSLGIEPLKVALSSSDLITTTVECNRQALDTFGKFITGVSIPEKTHDDLVLCTDKVSSIALLLDAQTTDKNLPVKYVFNNAVPSSVVSSKDYNYLSNFIASLKPVLGYDGQHSIAVLIEDTATLRSSGGLIKQLVMLKTENGKLSFQNSYNVPDAQKSFKGEIGVPEPWPQFLQTDNWKMQDVGLNNSQAKLGEDAVWFIEKLFNENKIDMVVFMPDTILVEIASLLGINTDLETIDYNMAFGLLLDSTNNNRASITTTILTGLNMGDLTLYFPEASINTSYMNLLTPVSNCFGRCVNLETAVLDNTLQGNASLLERKSSLTLSLGDKQIEATSVYQLKSGDNTNLDYESVLKFVLPKGAQIHLAEVNDKAGKKIIKPIETFGPTEKAVYVPIKVVRDGEVKLTWSINNLGLSSYDNVRLSMLKQPGVTLPTSIRVSYPDSYTVMARPTSLLTSQHTILYNIDLSTNFEAYLNLTNDN